MPSVCSSYNCKHRSNRTTDISYFKFPLKDKDLTKQWVIAMKRDKWFPTQYSYLCSAHFEEKYMYRTNNCRRLLAKAVPTIFSFSERMQKNKTSRSAPRKQLYKEMANDSPDISYKVAESDEMIVREDRWQDKDGQIHHILRVNPSLTADALPIIISDTKPHITFLLPKKRKTRDKKEEENFQAALEESMATYERELKTLQPVSFGETAVTALANGVTATTDEYSIMGSVKKECDGDGVVEYKKEVKTEIEITENNILEDNTEHATTSRDPLLSEEPEVALQPETVWLQECDMMSETDIKVECSGDPIDELKEEGDVEGWPDS